MLLIAHVSHYALGLLQAAPLLAVGAFAVWKSRAARTHARVDAVAHDRPGPAASHP